MVNGNPVRDTIEGGGVVFGARVRTFSPTAIQILGQAGLDYAYLDFEHAGFSPYNSSRLEQLALIADNAGLELVIRITGSNADMVRKVLDAGVRTVIVPRIETASEAKRVVKAAQFEYEGGPGERGFGTAPANDWGIRPTDYTEREDEHVFVGVMLETKEAVDNIQEITAVTGLGFAKIGVGDLSVSMGCPQDYENAALREAITRLETQCLDSSIPLGRGVSTVSQAKDALADGYQLIDIGGDVEILREKLANRMSELSEFRE
jgi:2-dehydro-3-deoxyglucarate aldolase